ncbi:MAG: asparagine synthase (glutamine-hydrolyzing) [Acidobacteria bacterium]|nr:MAG: asparagine synthase (glutamine-hydrolyzing) [Acidobacteriota bacterium]
MCGIAGYVGWARGPDESAGDLAQMCEAIRHRGPDDAGYFIAPGVALGMRRLSIIDVAGGAQPIANEDGSLQVVFNGEIYNYQEIRSRLEREGHRVVTGSDTETLVHLYEDHGPSLVHHLRGMFAFALWDTRRQTLLLARDRFGIKPLYYWQARGGLAFASELPSLQAMEWFPGRIDRPAVRDYLAFGYVPDPHSVFEGVRKLGPGQLLVWERGGNVRVSSYWSPARAEETRIDEREAAQELRRLLAEAVRYHLIADVPLGAFLSGGVDSSVVVAEMSRQMDRPVQTFSIGFEEPEFNEAKDAAAAAKALGTEHTALIVRPDVDALIEDVVGSFDEPFGDYSAIPTYLVCRLARQHVTVALSGDGGDELFGGYSRYLIGQRQREIQPNSIRHLIGAVARRLPHSVIGRNRLLDLSRTRWGRYAATLANPLQAAEGGIAESSLAESGEALDALVRRWSDLAEGRDFATQMTLVDILSYLPGDILTKVDRMSMAVSLEARVPLLDHRLAEFALSLPSHMKFRRGRGKWILRSAVADLVPGFVLAKPKQGFGVPLAQWFRHDLRHRLMSILDPGSPAYEYLDFPAVARLVKEHLSGRRDHSYLLWRALVLHLWLASLMSRRSARSRRSDITSLSTR